MRSFQYLGNGASLVLDAARCTGCAACVDVCPHGVLVIEAGEEGSARQEGRKARIADRGACMECGACAKNCPVAALTVDSGVGCAQAIILGKLRGTAPECGCSGTKGCC
jgi:ferredoxin